VLREDEGVFLPRDDRAGAIHTIEAFASSNED
jgi:hypothetical protein